MTTRTLPSPAQLRPLLANLLGKDVEITAGGSIDRAAARIDNYVGDDNAVCYVVGSSKEFSAYSGAALAMLPPGRAAEAIKDGGDEMLDMAYQEVLNVLTRAINDLGGDHVRLPVGESFETPDLSAVEPTTYTIDVSGYGSGVIAFWIN
ncbi:MAG: hypothetical protein R2733_02160 [Acidimicrobiales bacterium]